MCHFIGPFSFYYQGVQSDVTGHVTLKNNVWYNRFIKDYKFSICGKFGGYSLIADAAINCFLIFTNLSFEPCLNMLEFESLPFVLSRSLHDPSSCHL